MIGPFRPSREARGPDPYLRLKTVLFILGAIVGLVGIAMENDWLVGIGIAILAAGVALRALARRRG
ncbi:MAG TPA: hypothetical protein VF212_11420 [Longimicrobiales bacterium]